MTTRLPATTNTDVLLVFSLNLFSPLFASDAASCSSSIVEMPSSDGAAAHTLVGLAIVTALALDGGRFFSMLPQRLEISAIRLPSKATSAAVHKNKAMCLSYLTSQQRNAQCPLRCSLTQGHFYHRESETELFVHLSSQAVRPPTQVFFFFQPSSLLVSLDCERNKEI